MPNAAPGFILISLSLCNNRNRQKTFNPETNFKIILNWYARFYLHPWSSPSYSSLHADGASALPSPSYASSPPLSSCVPPLVCLPQKMFIKCDIDCSFTAMSPNELVSANVFIFKFFKWKKTYLSCISFLFCISWLCNSSMRRNSSCRLRRSDKKQKNQTIISVLQGKKKYFKQKQCFTALHNLLKVLYPPCLSKLAWCSW